MVAQEVVNLDYEIVKNARVSLDNLLENLHGFDEDDD